MKFALHLPAGLLVSFLSCFPAFLKADEPVSLDKLLTASEFEQSGLNKLTLDELKSLSAFLARFKDLSPTDDGTAIFKAKPGDTLGKESAADAPEPRAIATKSEAANFGAEQVAQINPVVTEKELHSRIEGTLESINGRSVFLLENGQVWQQRIPETIHFSPRLTNPKIVITRGLMGYKMLIIEADRFIYVKRIK